MRKDFIHYLEHNFARFSLRKDGGTWHLHGQETSLSQLETKVLVQLVEEKGYVVSTTNVRWNARKVVQKIRQALGSNYVKAQSRCEYIETVHREGLRWIYDPVRSRGFACLELRPIVASSANLASDMLFLQVSIESRAKNELNLNIYLAERPSDAVPAACFVIEGNCVSVNGTYRLILKISCSKLVERTHTFEVTTDNLFTLVDSATDKVIALLRDLIPETILTSL